MKIPPIFQSNRDVSAFVSAATTLLPEKQVEALLAFIAASAELSFSQSSLLALTGIAQAASRQPDQGLRMRIVVHLLDRAFRSIAEVALPPSALTALDRWVELSFGDQQAGCCHACRDEKETRDGAGGRTCLFRKEGEA